MNVPDIALHLTAEAQLDTLLGHPSHAVLLASPKGSGKTHIAAALVQQLLGVSELDTYAYYRLIQPDEKGTIPIEQVRTLINFFQLKVPGKASIRRCGHHPRC